MAVCYICNPLNPDSLHRKITKKYVDITVPLATWLRVTHSRNDLNLMVTNVYTALKEKNAI